MGPHMFCSGLLFPPVVKDLNHDENFHSLKTKESGGHVPSGHLNTLSPWTPPVPVAPPP